MFRDPPGVAVPTVYCPGFSPFYSLSWVLTFLGAELPELRSGLLLPSGV